MSGKTHEYIIPIEKGQAKYHASEQTSETSVGNVQITEVTSNVLEDETSPSDYIKEMFKSWDREILGEEKATRKIIQRVPEKMRSNKDLKKYFEPTRVSIGPIHHENSLLDEKMKLKLATKFFKGSKVDRERVYFRIIDEIKDLRECYEQDVTNCYNDDKLALMFLIDGCAVLELMKWILQAGKNFPNIRAVELVDIIDVGTIIMDLYLLENQLPYKVLDIVMTSCEKTEELRESIRKFIFHTAHLSKGELSMQEPPIHLLDLLWRSFNQDCDDKTNKKASFMEKINMLRSRHSIDILRMLLFPIVWFVRNILGFIVLRIMYVIHGILKPHRAIGQGLALYTIEDLKSAGIELIPRDTDHSIDIQFSEGKLMIPPISVTKSTPYIVFNLVAYEMLRGNERIVGPFVIFLSTLVTKAGDLKELRDSKILYNYLDSHEDLVELLRKDFKLLRKYFKITPDPTTLDLESLSELKYLKTYNDIQIYCNDRINVWVAEFKEEYLRSPWTVIALFGVILGVLLTIFEYFNAFEITG